MTAFAFIMLGQNQAAAPSSMPWLHVDTIFWCTILVIFLLAIIGVIIRLRQKDKCLKLLDDYHVTYLSTGGRTIWGDLRVASQGVELLFDAPYTNLRGLTKNSALIFDDELARCLAFCRTVHGLSELEQRHRRRQIRRSFRPGPLRRTWRWLRNVVNMVRDALTRTFSLIAGQVSRAQPLGGAIGGQQTQVDQLGATVIGLVGNAYEPILERHIGRPVILELTSPPGAEHTATQFSGYLVDYSDRFLAVFNVEHEPVEELTLQVTEPIEREGLRIEPADDNVTVHCTGDDAIIIRRMTCGSEIRDLAVVLTGGTNVRLARPSGGGGAVTLHLERTRRIDIVCPRSVARIRFGGAPEDAGRSDWAGTAPDERDLTDQPQ